MRTCRSTSWSAIPSPSLPPLEPKRNPLIPLPRDIFGPIATTAPASTFPIRWSASRC
jgi:hypothetical protein